MALIKQQAEKASLDIVIKKHEKRLVNQEKVRNTQMSGALIFQKDKKVELPGVREKNFHQNLKKQNKNYLMR